MSIKFSSVLTGIVFAVAFTASQKISAQGTGNTPQNTTTETKVIQKPPHHPRLIRELLYQVNEVNRKLQAGVVVQCRCNNDWWWANEAVKKTAVGDSTGDSQSHWSVIPEYKKIVRGYGHNMKEAKWDAMRACDPDPITFVPIEEENPPEVGPIGDGSKVTAVNGDTDGVGIEIEKALMWCHHFNRFFP